MADVSSAALAESGPATIVFDVDIRDRTVIEAIKRHRAGRPADQPWLFLVDAGLELHLSRTQAYALGATETLRRDGAVSALARRLLPNVQYPLVGPEVAALESRPAGRAVESAGRLMSSLFSAVNDRSQISPAAIRSGAETIAKSLVEVDLAVWLDTVRVHHDGTFQHCLLVAATAASYARDWFDQKEAQSFIGAAILHDIGKAEVPLHILDKPSKLTDAEFAVIARHPVVGHERLLGIGLPEPVLAAVRGHHETLDGSGYPDGLKGDRIAPITRALAVCDIFAALSEVRSYRQPMPADEAIAVLVDMALRNKLDYEPVRKLATTIGVHVPATLEDVIENLRAREA